jgi:hypothetical protein
METGRILVQGQPGQLVQMASQQMIGNPSQAGKHKEEDCGPGRDGHKARAYLKNNQC